MLLLGRYLSFYVRRVAIQMLLQDIPFERHAFGAYEDKDALRQHNPIGKIPALIRDDGMVLIESAYILDYLDHRAGPERALTPLAGPERVQVQQLVAAAAALVDKGTQLYYERTKRPPEKIEKAWEAWLQGQHASAMQALEARVVNTPWIGGASLTQADISVTCAYTWMTLELPEEVLPPGRYPNIEAVAARCEALPAFEQTSPNLAYEED